MIKILWNIVKGCKIKFPFLHQNIEFHSILYTQGTFGCWYYKFITLYKNISCQQKRGWWIIKIMCRALSAQKFSVLKSLLDHIPNMTPVQSWLNQNTKLNSVNHMPRIANTKHMRLGLVSATTIYWCWCNQRRQSQYWVFGEKDVIMVSLLMSAGGCLVRQ